MSVHKNSIPPAAEEMAPEEQAQPEARHQEEPGRKRLYPKVPRLEGAALKEAVRKGQEWVKEYERRKGRPF